MNDEKFPDSQMVEEGKSLPEEVASPWLDALGEMKAADWESSGTTAGLIPYRERSRRQKWEHRALNRLRDALEHERMLNSRWCLRRKPGALPRT